MPSADSPYHATGLLTFEIKEFRVHLRHKFCQQVPHSSRVLLLLTIPYSVATSQYLTFLGSKQLSTKSHIMKRKALAILFILVAVTLLAGILLLTKGVKAVNIKINKKDLPD
jgi:hypothetical protein